MGNATDIRTALRTGIVNAGITYPIAWEGSPFKDQPSNDETYLRISTFYNNPALFDLASTDKIKGFMQIDIYTPTYKGTLLASQIIDELSQVFPVNFTGMSSNGVKVQFTSCGKVGVMKADSPHNKTMCEVQFYSFVDRIV